MCGEGPGDLPDGGPPLGRVGVVSLPVASATRWEGLPVGKAQRLTTFRPFGRPWVGTSVSPVPLFFDHAPCDLQERCRAEFGLPVRSAFFHHAFEAGPDYR